MIPSSNRNAGISCIFLSAEIRPILLLLCGDQCSERRFCRCDAMAVAKKCKHHFLVCESDAIHGQPHKDIEITAPKDPPILAAHNSTAIISGRSDSYGNHVVFDNSTGYSPRYACMIYSKLNLRCAISEQYIVNFDTGSKCSPRNINL